MKVAFGSMKMAVEHVNVSINRKANHELNVQELCVECFVRTVSVVMKMAAKFANAIHHLSLVQNSIVTMNVQMVFERITAVVKHVRVKMTKIHEVPLSMVVHRCNAI